MNWTAEFILPVHQITRLSVIPFLSSPTQAKTLEQKRRWCQDIKKLILENYNAVIPDKAKELVMMLGKSKEEDGMHFSRTS